MLKRIVGIALAAAVFGTAAGPSGWVERQVVRVVQEAVAQAPGPAARPAYSRSERSVLIDRVLDGDTVAVRGWDQHVRLANIDAPEVSHGYGKPGQPFSLQSQRWLAREVEGRAGVTIRCMDEDRYRRPVCDLYRDGQHLNKELVRAGLAWANTASARYLRDRSVLGAQDEARQARRGLWSSPTPVEPWNWRRQCWEQKSCSAPW
jgi:micrococcal nuclease